MPCILVAISGLVDPTWAENCEQTGDKQPAEAEKSAVWKYSALPGTRPTTTRQPQHNTH